jgi:hypothetical protein
MTPPETRAGGEFSKHVELTDYPVDALLGSICPIDTFDFCPDEED